MSRQFMKWVSTVAKTANPKPFIPGEEISSAEIAGNGARMGTFIIPHPADRRKNALLMMAASFGTRESWILYEIQPLPSSQQVNRAPSQALSSDIDHFRSWAQEFQTAP
jgi:hypothetical protein